jgi:methylated-DNA-[protein]-cysteine S-methyltransferase
MASPIGWVGLVAGATGLVGIISHPLETKVLGSIAEDYPGISQNDNKVLEMAGLQILDYFRGRRREFDLPLDIRGFTPFTRMVLDKLCRVPFGATLTYAELGSLAGRPGSARAVGRVMAINPLPIVSPCHRVVGAGGKLTGYSGGEGIATKSWLLQFEQGRIASGYTGSFLKSEKNEHPD